jgi:hypothetical protein
VFPDGTEGRIERLLIKESQREQIRFSWWKDNNLIPRPLDLTEKELLVLFKSALQEGVFSEDFSTDLRHLFE